MEPIQRFGDDRYAMTAVGFVKFEIKSWVGRLLSPSRRVARSALLQLGSGANPVAGFENLDFFAMRAWKMRHIGHDLRYSLPYSDAVFEGAFSEHTLEHLTSSDARSLLREVRRVLKPGSVFRVIVPDLGQYVAFYNNAPSSPEFAVQFASGCEAIWSLTQNFGHLSCWDAAMLTKQLLAAGFSEATPTVFRQSRDDRLVLDLPARRWESLYVDAIA